jgi:hypothetical protein
MPQIKKLGIIQGLYYYKRSKFIDLCGVCKQPIVNTLVRIVNKKIFHENCITVSESESPIEKLQLDLENASEQLASDKRYLFCGMCKKEITIKSGDILVRIADGKMFHENCNTPPDIHQELKFLQHKLAQETSTLQLETQKVQQLTDANQKLLTEIQRYRQQQIPTHKFDDFRAYTRRKLNIGVNLQLVEFCKTQLRITLIANFTIGKLVSVVVKAIQDNAQSVFLWNLFSEQLGYALACSVCYTNSSMCTHQELALRCRNHQAILVNYNGIYYGGIFIGYAPPDKTKVVIQWFEDGSFSVMDVSTCYNLTPLNTMTDDKSIPYGNIYNEGSDRKFWVQFPELTEILNKKNV